MEENGSLMSQENIQFSLDTTNQYNPKVVSVQDNEFLIPGNIINDIIINKRNSIGSIAEPIPAG